MSQMSWMAIVEREHRERRKGYGMAFVLLASVVAILAAVITSV